MYIVSDENLIYFHRNVGKKVFEWDLVVNHPIILLKKLIPDLLETDLNVI